MENKDFLIQLTNALYRLTLLFPKKEPLRYKMREKADDILAKPNKEDFEILNKFFNIAKSQNWVSQTDVLAVKEEYDRLRAEIELEETKIETGTDPLDIAKTMPLRQAGTPHRQEKIITILAEKGQAQVWQVKELFPEVTKRTLRRDFEQMVNNGLIERFGQKNETFYKIKQA